MGEELYDSVATFKANAYEHVGVDGLRLGAPASQVASATARARAAARSIVERARQASVA